MNLRKESAKQGAILAAWRDLHTSTRLGVIQSKAEYNSMTSLLNELVDIVGDDEDHPLAGLLEIVGVLIRQYEDDNVRLPATSPREALKFLMEQHALRQSDLRDEIGSQGVVSEILGGKREINARQAKALGARFNISPSVFL